MTSTSTSVTFVAISSEDADIDPEAMRLIEKLAVGVAILCLTSAAAGVGFSLWTVFDEPDTARPSDNLVTDVRAYDVDQNGDPEFAEINGGVHAVAAPAAKNLWLDLAAPAATIASAIVAAAAAMVVGLQARGDRFDDHERRLGHLERPITR